ncbi:unnamed protein product [Heterotrigona itama]|uniref:Uncharacterized protein n=1 Tax=Heterotrigona itama TaxID=395501 RepID=A0A6V7H1A4_9HYME|nr:unnamed protein product [Heterotrigona itama]
MWYGSHLCARMSFKGIDNHISIIGLNNLKVNSLYLLACVPIFPNLIGKELPTKPLHPNIVQTMPLKELRPPVPLFKPAVVGFLMILGSCNIADDNTSTIHMDFKSIIVPKQLMHHQCQKCHRDEIINAQNQRTHLSPRRSKPPCSSLLRAME